MNSNINQLIKNLAASYQLTMDESLENELRAICHALFTSAHNSDSTSYLAFLRAAKVLNKPEPIITQSSPLPHDSVSSDLPIKAFCDGACSGNPGAGGWGAVVIAQGIEHQLSGGEIVTTNNRMELCGAIAALSFIKKNGLIGHITITTDSQYVKNGINSWMAGWKRNGWLTASKEPVKNKDLWIVLDAINSELKPLWLWVKGHKGHYYNELCDRLAVKERDLLKG